MGLIIALDDNNQASGELFWDDGDSRGTNYKNVLIFLLSLLFRVYGVCTVQSSLMVSLSVLFAV